MQNKKSLLYCIGIVLILVILLAIFANLISGNNYFSKVNKGNFRLDMLKYKSELDIILLEEKMANEKFNKNLVNVKEFNEIKRYIKSIDDNYRDIIEIKKGNILYKGKNKAHKEIATEVGLLIEKEENNGEGTRIKSEASWLKPYIPKGFSHLEGTVNDGFVIIDDILENEFVWIPVKNTGLGNNYLEMGDYKKVDFEDKNKSVDVKNTEDLSIEELKRSIKKYGGFYLARYEAGEDNLEGNVIIASRRGLKPYTNVDYNEAEIFAANFYANHNVGSMLMPGAAYDSVIRFIQDATGRNIDDFRNYVTDFGNFDDLILETGSSEIYKMKNIYDLAGNVFEYTAELDKATGKYLLRGGCVGYNPYKIDMVRRNVPINGYEKSELIGFRPVLYIK